MRHGLKSGRRWLSTGWIWPLALLALPNCILQTGGLGPPLVFEPGLNPADAIMCDIPEIPVEGDECAASDELYGMSLAKAAVALNEGDSNTLVLDWSASSACPSSPRKIVYAQPFPDGMP